ncbi:ABC transporter permease subunit [Variovorax paradoxus]|uniref:ABC transporter permease subunit n=1 Tax=Variovorax paradoxus TaxID=34073 RepID=UPI0009BC2BF1|nr:ABC transporter permease subunit [Variovorax paradoxus]
MSIHPPQGRRLLAVMRQEFRLMLAERGLWLVGALFLLLVAYALGNGLVQTAKRDRAQAAVAQADRDTRAAQRVQLEAILAGTAQPTPFENPADPSRMASGYGGQHALLPTAPLGPVALGQSDLFPSQYKVTNQSRVVFMNPSDIENPWHLLSGHFDLAFVIVYLLPLLIFALSYNLLSAERENGTLRLLLSQPLRLRTLLAGKLTVRAAVLLGPAVLLPVAVLWIARHAGLAGASGEMGSATLWWALLVGAYALFWFALVVAVNAFGASSATNAMVLVIAWVVLVLVAPVLLNLAVTQAAPAPSRTELATRQRVVTAEAMKRHQDLLGTEYQHVGQGAILVPRNGKIEIAGRALANYRIEREVDEAIRPALDRFDAQQARQQQLLGRFGAVSPAAVAYEGMTALAGNGARRHARFEAQTVAHHEAWKAFFFPRIDARDAFTPDGFDRIPTFAWQEEPASLMRGQAALAVVQLLVPSLLLFGLAAWRLRRFSVA